MSLAQHSSAAERPRGTKNQINPLNNKADEAVAQLAWIFFTFNYIMTDILLFPPSQTDCNWHLLGKNALHHTSLFLIVGSFWLIVT